MFVKQLSVFLENSEGALIELLEKFALHQVNILALSIADTKDYGIVRIIVSSADTAFMKEQLHEAGFMARVDDVACLRIPNTHGRFLEAFKVFEQEKNNLEYAYCLSTTVEEDAVLILRLSDMQQAAQKLEECKVTLVSQAEIDAL